MIFMPLVAPFLVNKEKVRCSFPFSFYSFIITIIIIILLLT